MFSTFCDLNDATSEDSGTATPQQSWLLQERESQLSSVRIDKVNRPYVIVLQGILQLLRACGNEMKKHVPPSSFPITFSKYPNCIRIHHPGSHPVVTVVVAVIVNCCNTGITQSSTINRYQQISTDINRYQQISTPTTPRSTKSFWLRPVSQQVAPWASAPAVAAQCPGAAV